MFKKFISIIILFLSPHKLQAEGVECDLAREFLVKASDIRKLEIKASVPCLLQNKEQVKAYLLAVIEEQLPPDKLRYEEFVYKKIGFFPQDFDYKQGIVELYLSQIGGYYDPKKKRFIMADWLPETMQTSIAVHELTHALQDQYYDLDKFIDPKIENADTILARSALVEGDASAVMHDYLREHSGQLPIADEADIDDLVLATVAASHFSASSVPKSMRMVLIFPYTSGLRFVHSIIKEKGYAGLHEVYNNPPRSTEEILYPEKYLRAEADFIEFNKEDLESYLSEGHDKLYQDTLGQLGIMALLSMYDLKQAEIKQASDGWGGDRIMLFAKDGQKVIIWKSNWDQESDRAEFQRAFYQTLKQRFPAANEKEFETEDGDLWKIKSASKSLTVKVFIGRSSQ